ncbi:hypothetical protein Bealeia1_01707 [Candidatus Bealeia paramacronuclearis]|uniref:Uncharacterized protein n=1 Tax=Candidatus Bealeia paramacronuclearis TaxID=1921001 RepID=A0ABZ2C7K4_9PROT|nr:hypothetical protein [Candidatus Bealeia paramacronuclearis]
MKLYTVLLALTLPFGLFAKDAPTLKLIKGKIPEIQSALKSKDHPYVEIEGTRYKVLHGEEGPVIEDFFNGEFAEYWLYRVQETQPGVIKYIAKDKHTHVRGSFYLKEVKGKSGE